MTTLLTRMFKDRCTDCMAGQGDRCACRDAQPERYSSLSPAVNVLLILVFVIAVKLKLFVLAWVMAVAAVGYMAWRAVS